MVSESLLVTHTCVQKQCTIFKLVIFYDQTQGVGQVNLDTITGLYISIFVFIYWACKLNLMINNSLHFGEHGQVNNCPIYFFLKVLHMLQEI